MNAETQNANLPRPLDRPSDRHEVIDRVLDSLRGKIRQYVLVHGLLLAAIWVCFSFWIAFALDYLPVTLGFSELSRPVRLCLLVLIAAVFGHILFHHVFRRVTRRLSRESLAILLERRFPDLNDALATVVQTPELNQNAELAGLSATESQAARQQHERMMRSVKGHAESTLKKSALSHVFNFRPLIWAGLATLVLASSVGWFAVAKRDAFSTAFRRIYFLDQDKWPRDCRIELVGLKIKHAESIDGIPEMNRTQIFQEDQIFVGAASKVSLLVKAEMPDASSKETKNRRRLPRLCEFTWRSSSGKSGRMPMTRIGGARDGFQTYALDQEILDGVVEDLTFYVRGDDHRIGPFHIKVVSPPIVVQRIADCVYPDYLVDEASSRFTPRQLPITSGMKLPIGTAAKIQVEADRPLQRLFVLGPENQVLQTLDGKRPVEGKQAEARFDIANLQIQETVDLSVMIQDQHGVFSEAPTRIRIAAESDKPPQVSSRLQGIGVAVTPDARIPLVAEIKDQHGVQEVWFELQTPLTDTMILSQEVTNGTLEGEIDLRQLRIGGQIPADLPTQSPNEIVLSAVAKDFCDLNTQPNIGAGNQHPLEVVSADRMLRILEREEADQRFRLEQIYREMTEARDYIRRGQADRNNAQSRDAGFEPGDRANTPANAESSQDWDLRLLFLQRAVLQTQKSRGEIQGVAFSFDHIRLQLINNRVDAEDRKQRLQDQVATPLSKIAESSMPDLEDRLGEAIAVYRELAERTQQDRSPELANGSAADSERLADELALASLTSVDGVLAEIQSVLDSLLKFETQNELLDLVRNMLEQQTELQKRTDALRNKEAFDDIFNK